MSASFPSSSGGAVDSVNGETGVVVLTAAEVGADPAGSAAAAIAASQPVDSDLTAIAALTTTSFGRALLALADAAAARTAVGLGNVDNTSDASKPVSTAQQAALNLKAPLASPTLTGIPAGPTAAPGTNTTQLATTAFVAASPSGIPATTIDAKGDLLVGTADDTVARKAAGTNGAALVADSLAADGLAYAQKTVPVASGNYLYHPSTSAADSTQGAGSIVIGSIVVSKRQTFDRITVSIQTAATGNVRLLIYADSNGVPGSLLLDAGTVDVSTTGLKEIVISQSLAAGVYWLGAFAETTAGTVGWTANNGLGLLANFYESIPGISPTRSGFYKGGNTIGSPPDPFGTPGGATNFHPIIALRVT